MLYLPQLFLVVSNDLEKSFVFVTCSLLCWAAFFQRHSPSRLNCSFPSIHIFTGYYNRRLAVGTRCLFPFYIFLQTTTKKACCLFFSSKLYLYFTEHAIIHNGIYMFYNFQNLPFRKSTSLCCKLRKNTTAPVTFRKNFVDDKNL